MILPDFKDFVAKLPPTGRVLGIDWGQKRVGLAISDAAQEFAFPKETKKCDTTVVGFECFLSGEIVSSPIVGIVIGLPVFSDGSESETTTRVREFAEHAEKLWKKVPITFLDETLSSAEAEEMMRSASKPDQGRGLDAFAAAIILEDALAKIKRIRNARQD